MKKLLIAICVTILLAAPIQLASATSINTEERSPKLVTQYKWWTVNKTINVTADYVWNINKVTKNQLIKLVEKKAVTTSKPVKKQQQQQVKSPVKQQQEPTSVTEVPKQQPTKEVVTEETKQQQQQQSEKIETETPKQQEQQPTTPVAETPQQTQKNEAVKETPASATGVTGTNAFEQQVLTLTNAERAKQGLAALQADTKLMAAAREKSVDMQKNNYFSHTSPTFGSPFDRLKALGISYKSAGENIAKGQRTPAEVVQAWMDSPGHRANILNTSYTHLGVGFVENGYYWTQQFIQK